VVKAFRAAGLSFPWRHQKGPRKGEVDWQPLRHHAVLRVLHNPRYAGAFTYGRHRHHKLPSQCRCLWAANYRCVTGSRGHDAGYASVGWVVW